MEAFCIYSNELRNRIDPHYYRPYFIKFYEQMMQTKFKLTTIAEISEKVTSGATPLSKGEAYTTKEEGIPFIRSGDINEDKSINFDDILFIEEKIHNNLLKGSKLKKGDILIAIVGATIGQISIWDYDKEANINQAIALVRLKQEINPEYIKAFMISTLGQKQLDRIKRPVARANINLDEIRNLNIILPPLEIQNKIVSLMDNAYKNQKYKNVEANKFIDSINNFVLSELNIIIPDLKDNTTYSINYTAVQNKRLDVNYYQSKFKNILNSIEKGKYPIKKLKELLDYTKKGIEVGSEEYLSDGVPFVRVADITNYNTNLKTAKKISQNLYNQLKEEYNPKKGELLFSKDGTIGICNLVKNDDEFIVSNGILRLKCKIDVNSIYVKSILSNYLFQLLLERESIGAIIKHLSPGDLLNLYIPIPPFSIQNKIAEEVNNRLEKAKKLQEEAKMEVEKAKEEVEKIILNQ